jgi:hypothetical protein
MSPSGALGEADEDSTTTMTERENEDSVERSCHRRSGWAVVHYVFGGGHIAYAYHLKRSVVAAFETFCVHILGDEP